MATIVGNGNVWDYIKKLSENIWSLMAGVAIVAFNTGMFTEKARRDRSYVSNEVCGAHHEALKVELQYLNKKVDKICTWVENQPHDSIPPPPVLFP